MTGIVIAALFIAVPALAWTLWPLVRGGSGGASFLPLPPDAREQLLESKRVALRALRELAFEHDAGHVSDADYADLRGRYEAEAAAILTELDRLGPLPVRPQPAPVAAAPARGWRHPLALGAGAVALLVFGVAIGVGIVRYSEPDRSAAMGGGGLPGTSGAAPSDVGPITAGGGGPSAANAPTGPITPAVMQGMLEAARQALFAGQYTEAITAYRAILRHDPNNVDAMTHLALIVAIGGHADTALQTFDKVLSMDPNYAPALLYRGQVLYEVKNDPAGAIKSWEKFLVLVPSGEDHDRVSQMIAEARTRPLPKK